MTTHNERQKKYKARPEIRAKETARQREFAASDVGQAYEQRKNRRLSTRYSRGRCNARRRGKSFTITLKEYEALMSAPCAYCNLSIDDETGIGLDRMDNTRGYEPGNCNPCCAACNRRRAKSMGADEFKKQTKINNRWNG